MLFNALAWDDENSRAAVQAIFAAAPEAVRAKDGSADDYILHVFDHSRPQDDRRTLISSRILEQSVSGYETTLQVEYNWALGRCGER